MKLLIEPKDEKLLFAEASKTVVDFLFNLLRLPLATMVRDRNKNVMAGSLGNLYHSVENLITTATWKKFNLSLLL